MIQVPFGATPPSLDGPDSTGAKETARAIAFYAIETNRTESFPYSAYKGADVVLAYAADFRGKCAYCETPYRASQPVDSEHYRPKGGYFKKKDLKKPGYYWLAADWRNLLPSCVDCNRGRTQTFPDRPSEVSGKTNYFPIADERRRAKRPGTEARETRLLLHPRLDDPNEHLAFGEDGIVRVREDPAGRESPMGAASIKVYGLQRDGLVQMRTVTAKNIRGAIDLTMSAADVARQIPGHPALLASLGIHVAHLRQLMAPEQAYAAVARHMAGPIVESLEAEFGPLGH